MAKNSAYKAHNFTVKAVTTTSTDKTTQSNQVYIPSYHGKFDITHTEGKSNSSTVFQYPYAVNSTGNTVASGSVVWILFEGGDVRCPVIITDTKTSVNSNDFPGLPIDNVGGVDDATVDTLSTFTGSTTLDLARELLLMNESGGNYATVVGNDNGALSVGLIGWHELNAQTLFQRIKKNYPKDWTDNGGNKIANLDGDWHGKKVEKGSAEDKAMQAVLSSPGGKKVQDEMLAEYFDSYVKQAQACGVTDAPALVFYCDMAVQTPYGAQSVVQNAKKKDLDGLYNEVMGKDYWLSTAPYCGDRRKKSYQLIKQWIKDGKFNADPSGVSDPNMPFVWPVPYKDSSVTSKYGYRTLDGKTTSFHSGIDISTLGAENNDKAILATATGTVINANSNCTHNYRKSVGNHCGCGGGAGRWVTIKHKEGNYVSHYLHLSNIFVKIGDEVRAGQQIGTMGCTGYSLGWHLHFQIMQNGDTTMGQQNSVDPLKFVGKK